MLKIVPRLKSEGEDDQETVVARGLLAETVRKVVRGLQAAVEDPEKVVRDRVEVRGPGTVQEVVQVLQVEQLQTDSKRYYKIDIEKLR